VRRRLPLRTACGNAAGFNLLPCAARHVVLRRTDGKHTSLTEARSGGDAFLGASGTLREVWSSKNDGLLQPSR